MRRHGITRRRRKRKKCMECSPMEMASSSPMKYVQEDGTPLAGSDAAKDQDKKKALGEYGDLHGGLTGGIMRYAAGESVGDILKEEAKDYALTLATGGLYNPVTKLAIEGVKHLQEVKKRKLYASGYEESNVGAMEI